MEISRRRLFAVGAAGAVLPARAASLATARDIQGVLDPAWRLGALEANVLRAVCPGLIAADDAADRWSLALAEAISQPTPRTIAFRLRPGLRFSHGYGAVTSADVRFSFERFARAGAAGLPTYAADWALLEGVEIVDELSGIIHLRAPAPALWRTVLPDASGCIISRRALDDGAYRIDHGAPVVPGAGRLTLAAWRPGRAVSLMPSDNSATPITLRPVRDIRTATLALRGGAVDFAAVPPEDLRALGATPGLRVIDRQANNIVWIGMNCDMRPLDQADVRAAIRAGIDVEQVLLGGWDGAVAPARGPIAPAMVGHWADAPRAVRDVAAARALLARAGFPNGLDLTLTLLNDPEYQQAGVVIRDQLAAVGIRVRLDVRDPGAFWSADAATLALSLQRFGAKSDPDFLMQWFTPAQIGGWNWQRWNSPDFAALIARAAGTPDGPERERLYVDAQRLMDQAGCFVWLTHGVVACAHAAGLRPAVMANGDDWLLDRFGWA